MTQVRLTAKTKHGKNRLQQQGDIWNVERFGKTGNVLSTLEDPSYWRFVHHANDEHFEMEVIRDDRKAG